MRPLHPYTAAQMLAALRKHKSVSAACKKLGISRATFYRTVPKIALWELRMNLIKKGKKNG